MDLDPVTIKLFLVNGEPRSLRTVELSNWSGKAVSAPRSELSDLQKRPESSNPGVYILTGVDDESGDDAVYIGEAENIATRLRGHSDKEFWNNVAIFVSKDDNLTKSHIRYLEGELIRLATESRHFKVMNSAGSGAKLPESDAADMNVFLGRILQLLPVIGIADISIRAPEEVDDRDIFYCKVKGLVANGIPTPGGFTIFKESEAVLEHMPSAKRSRIRREKLMQSGALAKNSDRLIFTRDIEFSSPSAAATTVKGGSANGQTSWVNAAGRTLRQVEANET